MLYVGRNALGMVPPDAQPRSRILGPRLKELDKARAELKGHLADLVWLFGLSACYFDN